MSRIGPGRPSKPRPRSVSMGMRMQRATAVASAEQTVTTSDEWQLVSELAAYQFVTLPSGVLVARSGSSVLLSADEGLTWAQGWTHAAALIDLAVCDSRILIVDASNKIWGSDDGGQTFSMLQDIGWSIQSIASLGGGVALVSYRQFGNSAVLKRSTDCFDTSDFVSVSAVLDANPAAGPLLVVDNTHVIWWTDNTFTGKTAYSAGAGASGTWVKGGNTGDPPVAWTADAPRAWVVTSDGSKWQIKYSDDYGVTWQTVHTQNTPIDGIAQTDAGLLITTRNDGQLTLLRGQALDEVHQFEGVSAAGYPWSAGEFELVGTAAGIWRRVGAQTAVASAPAAAETPLRRMRVSVG